MDTPGYQDFIGEIVSAARVSDAAIAPIDALGGFGTGTIQALSYMDDKPILFFVNKIEKDNADFGKILQEIEESVGGTVVPFSYPIGVANEFKGVVDILKKKAYKYDGAKPEEIEIPGDIDIDSLREQLIDAAAETDEALMEKYFEAGELTDEEIARGLKNGIMKGDLKPVYVGSATMAAGINILMDAIVDILPSPADKPHAKGKPNPESEEEIEMVLDPEGPFSAFVFKTVNDPHLGNINYLRLYSGTATSGLDLRNENKNGSERLGAIYINNGKERKEVEEAMAGDIIATVKLKNTSTGDTLSTKEKPIVYEPAENLPAAIDVAVEAESKGDADKVARGLSRLSEEDPTFSYRVDSELHQTILYGQGELQLDFIVKTLADRFNVKVDLVKPKIPYRETVAGKAEAQGKYKKQSGGHGQFGDVYLKIAPRNRGEGFEFVNEVVGGVIPTKFIPSVEKGVVEAMLEGPLSASPVIDVQVTVYYGSYHSVDSSDMAFKNAAKLAFNTVFEKADPYLLEPVYSLEIMVTDDFTGDVMGDISSRRGKIQGMEPRGKFQVIKAQVPQSELYKYSTFLRSIKQGTGVYKREFSHYEKVPHEIQLKVIEENKKEAEE